ncbi:MAG TPA: efflux RND transporter periplasmic adaptor subunit [Candidatus Coprenecus stercoravium]|uniref:Efflux RND transporter periplasmic adaptor subunit n=1 Tax=Candidatus Coprenecus stercoravium TaxID=2840735 RepID=A0A9D2K9B0_9BACT|nr:efflux RND transporter periplasmic adaptor subunit [Candidatus Coprenecus stercoravium]
MENTKLKKALIWSIAAAVLAAAVIIWLTAKPAGKSGIGLETAPVIRTDIHNSVTATGTVEPVTLVEVGTQVSGIIDRLYVDYNDHVKAGQLIAEMDKVTLESELEQAEAQLAASKTEYEYRMKEYLRKEQLHQKELISDSEYDEALYLYESAKNTYALNQASIIGVRRNLGYATITSPIDGVIISRAVEEGQTVAAGFETPTLFTIANDLTDMQVVADVDEADIGYVKEGQRVEFTVDAYPDDIFSGQVLQVRLEATTESSVVTYEVVISAANPELKLKPGLTANVTIYTLDRRNVCAVPSKALRFVPDPEIFSKVGFKVSASAQGQTAGRTVWTLRGTDIIPRTVSIGATDGDMTEIISGLGEGETVISGLRIAAPEVKGPEMERSPFMPGPPK